MRLFYIRSNVPILNSGQQWKSSAQTTDGWKTTMLSKLTKSQAAVKNPLLLFIKELNFNIRAGLWHNGSAFVFCPGDCLFEFRAKSYLC